MKKFIALALALVLTLSMAVVAFAEETEDIEAETSKEIEVTGTYEVETIDGDICVNVAWNAPTWTYTVTKTWDAIDAEYDYTTAWTGSATTITATNKSAFKVNVTVEVEEKIADTYVTYSIEGEETATLDPRGVHNASVAIAKKDGAGVMDGNDGDTIAIATATITIAKWTEET